MDEGLGEAEFLGEDEFRGEEDKRCRGEVEGDREPGLGDVEVEEVEESVIDGTSSEEEEEEEVGDKSVALALLLIIF